MTIPKEDRPVAQLQIDISAHPKAMKQIARWLREQADYLLEHQTEVSKHFRARYFVDKGPREK